eukprot:COSAG04_NODE_216_length_19953_cov_85.343558_17_plen_47_part_00
MVTKAPRSRGVGPRCVGGAQEDGRLDLGETVKARKKREKTGGKWAR